MKLQRLRGLFEFLICFSAAWFFGCLFIQTIGCNQEQNRIQAAPIMEMIPNSNIEIYHDKKRGVTCYYATYNYSPAISCLPDSRLSDIARQ